MILHNEPVPISVISVNSISNCVVIFGQIYCKICLQFTVYQNDDGPFSKRNHQKGNSYFLTTLFSREHIFELPEENHFENFLNRLLFTENFLETSKVRKFYFFSLSLPNLK